MAKVRVEIIYVDKLEKVLVNGVAINDLTSIQYKPVHEWFAASNGRDGWEGLIPEIFNIVDDQSAELCFEFVGPNEKAHIFLECLQEIGYGDTSISPEEVAKRNLEGARRAEHRGLYLQAFENYLNAADYGNSAEAQYEVAKFYYAQFKEDKSRGEHICGDIPKLKAIGNAVKYWEKAAQQGFSEACFRLHELFSFGDGVTKDQTEAVKWLTAAINNLEASPLTKIETAFTSVDEIMEEIGKNADALQVYQQAAEKNYVIAQLVVGVCYESGNGIKQNLSMAAEWYQKAAEQNYAPAQLKLGSCYDKGEGVKKNPQTAVEWYRKAAEQNYAQAQCALGICYENGKGVEKNLEIAVAWYRRAAEQGDALAQYNLGLCYERGQGTEKNIETAAEWCKRAAKQDYVPAQRDLGIYYEYGRGVTRNVMIAVVWYRRAAEQNDATAQRILGICYEEGKGVLMNAGTAVEWYQRAAEQGDAIAQCNLGHCYEFGYGVKKDYKMAVDCYSKAIAGGNIHAMYLLGYCYECGTGVKKNLATALSWYRKAVDDENLDADICFRIGKLFEDQNKSNAEPVVRTGVLISVSLAIPVTNWVAIPAAITGSKIIALAKKKAFRRTENATAMIKYYRKAAALGHPEAKKKLKHWK